MAAAAGQPSPGDVSQSTFEVAQDRASVPPVQSWYVWNDQGKCQPLGPRSANKVVSFWSQQALWQLLTSPFGLWQMSQASWGACLVLLSYILKGRQGEEAWEGTAGELTFSG